MRAVAAYDYGRARLMGCWPVVELLRAYTEIVRRAALQDHQVAVLVWAVREPRLQDKKPPELPDILREDS